MSISPKTAGDLADQPRDHALIAHVRCASPPAGRILAYLLGGSLVLERIDRHLRADGS
jgi:hypothetical protein